MSIPVVDLLKTVKIKAKNGGPVPVLFGRSEILRDSLLKQHPIRQSRKSVMVRQLKELLMEVATLSYVLGNNKSAFVAAEKRIVCTHLYVYFGSVFSLMRTAFVRIRN